ncbi:MAG: hypothetical protein ACK4K0_09460 [Flavobacteriales bacterium]
MKEVGEIKLAGIWASESLYQSAVQLFSLEEGAQRKVVKLPRPRFVKLIIILIKTTLMKTIEFFGYLINHFKTLVNINKLAEKQNINNNKRKVVEYDSPFLKNTFKKK